MTRDEFIALRKQRIELDCDIQRRLDRTGIDGFATMREFGRLRWDEDRAWEALTHDDRMAVLNDDKVTRDALIARIDARKAQESLAGATT